MHLSHHHSRQSPLGSIRFGFSGLPFRWLTPGGLAALAALHGLLGIACKVSPWMAAIHTVVSFLVGIFLVAVWRGPLPLACWAAYVVGSELLWRIARSPLPWEGAKYEIAFVLLLGYLRNPEKRFFIGPIAYLALLLPAVVPVLAEYPLAESRELISFNLSGPLSLAAASLFMSKIQLDGRRIVGIMLSLTVPLVGLAAALVFGLNAAGEITFGTQSNSVTSGGLPVQVASILGLGSLYCMALALGPGFTMLFRMGALACAVWFATHAALTFSRSGVYLLSIGIVTLLLLLPFKWTMRPRTLLFFATVLVLSLFAWSLLVQYTGGKISTRMAETSLTGRERIAQVDLEIWNEHPLLGVGTGMASVERGRRAGGGRITAHNEYSRLLSEHGLLGVAAGCILIAIFLRSLTNSPRGFSKAVVVTGVTFTTFWLCASGMRTSAPGFLLGMACARLVADQPRVARRRILPSPRMCGPLAPRGMWGFKFQA